jgi:sugar/nucleoside kinase (ribokinase family)
LDAVEVATREKPDATYVATSRTTVTVVNERGRSTFRISPIAAVDPTGAGDAFAGGFLSAQLQGSGLRHRVITGMLCGLASVTDFGVRTLMSLASSYVDDREVIANHGAPPEINGTPWPDGAS